MNPLATRSIVRLKIPAARLPSVSNHQPNIEPHGPAKAASPVRHPAGQRLQCVLKGIVTQVEGDLRRIGDFPEGGIHSLRRRMKKLRPILALVRGQFPLQTRQQIKRHIRLLKGSFAG